MTKRSVKKISDALLSALILFAMLMFLSAPARYAQSVSNGISLWAANVLPAVFPFLFFTALFTGLPLFRRFSEKLSPVMGKLFRVSGAGGGAAILSALSGYPVGARIVYDMNEKKLTDKEENFRLACLCSTSGPMFLVGTAGSILYESGKAGWFMLLSHLAAVWLICFCLRFTAGRVSSAPRLSAKKTETQFSDGIYGAVISVLCVGGCIALFSAFSQMLADLRVFSFCSSLFGGAYTEGVLRGLIEMTAGCQFLSSFRTPLSCALSSAIVTFGGLCVILQETAYLSRAGIKTAPFLLVKFLQAALAFVLCFTLCSLFGID